MASPGPDWFVRHEAKMRQMWDEGASTQQIAAACGTTKNGVVGKAHRIGLPARPSPILRSGDGRERAPRKTPARSARQAAAASAIGLPAVVAGAPESPAAAIVPVETRPVPVVVKAVSPRARECQWPLWAHNARPDHRYCGAPAAEGRSYCTVHVAFASERRRPVIESVDRMMSSAGRLR